MAINIDISKISSKGQIVIPKKMREHFKEGDNIVLIEEDNRIILKNIEDLSDNFKEDHDLKYDLVITEKQKYFF